MGKEIVIFCILFWRGFSSFSFIIAMISRIPFPVEFWWEKIEGNLSLTNSEPHIHFRRANTEPSMDFRKANIEPSITSEWLPFTALFLLVSMDSGRIGFKEIKILDITLVSRHTKEEEGCS